MTSQQLVLCDRLKKLGYSQGNRIRIYGEEFDLVSDPITLRDQLVFVDGVERKTGVTRRVRIPLPVVRMIFQDIRAA
jgi:hypothetical protein